MEKPYEIGSSPDGTYVYARAFRAPYTAELAFSVAGELVPIGKELSVLGCLIDLRGTEKVSSVVDKYEFAYERAMVAGLPHHWRYAFLVDHGEDSPDFIETVMSNAGYVLRIFKDKSMAIDWLKEAQST